MGRGDELNNLALTLMYQISSSAIILVLIILLWVTRRIYDHFFSVFRDIRDCPFVFGRF